MTELALNALKALQHCAVDVDGEPVAYKDSEPYCTEGFDVNDIGRIIGITDRKDTLSVIREWVSLRLAEATDYDDNERPIAWALTDKGCKYAVR